MKLKGKHEFNRRLEEGFEKGYVDLTNQSRLEASFLFNYSGKPWLTQKYSRMAANEYFSTSPYTAWMGEKRMKDKWVLCIACFLWEFLE